METRLTTQIKKATHSYAPRMSRMRTIRYADEVTTPSGIVDSVRFEDVDVGPIECKSMAPCKWPERKENCCKGCVYRKHRVTPKMIITCFEVKITMADFHSGHGSNFWGHLNYYCVPQEIAPLIDKELGETSHIGILAWNGNRLRKYRPAKYIETFEKTQILLLYNAMKKWCDGIQQPD